MNPLRLSHGGLLKAYCRKQEKVMIDNSFKITYVFFDKNEETVAWKLRKKSEF
jgi:hypothetical protein